MYESIGHRPFRGRCPAPPLNYNHNLLKQGTGTADHLTLLRLLFLFLQVLREHPWLAEGALSVESRILIMKVFEALLANGWKITASVDVSRKIEDMTTFVFEK